MHKHKKETASVETFAYVAALTSADGKLFVRLAQDAVAGRGQMNQ